MRPITPRIIFLDYDLQKSAQYLTNHSLEMCIKSCVQILMCSIYYMLGFRTKSLFKYYFSKDKWKETRDKYFHTYPLTTAPTFSYYNSPESRWCRKCINHYNYISNYLWMLLDEYGFRFNKEHKLSEMYDFLYNLPLVLQLKYGLKIPKLKDESKMQLPWKNLPIQCRKKDLIEGYRKYYRNIVFDPIMAYVGTKRDVPDFLMDKIESIV